MQINHIIHRLSLLSLVGLILGLAGCGGNKSTISSSDAILGITTFKAECIAVQIANDHAEELTTVRSFFEKGELDFVQITEEDKNQNT